MILPCHGLNHIYLIDFDGLSFKDIELDQFSMDDKQEEIKIIAVFKEN